MYNIDERSNKMRNERKVDFLYTKNVIKPLESLIRKVTIFDDVSLKERKKLDKLLLEKYVKLEQILQEEYHSLEQ